MFDISAPSRGPSQAGPVCFLTRLRPGLGWRSLGAQSQHEPLSFGLSLASVNVTMGDHPSPPLLCSPHVLWAWLGCRAHFLGAGSWNAASVRARGAIFSAPHGGGGWAAPGQGAQPTCSWRDLHGIGRRGRSRRGGMIGPSGDWLREQGGEGPQETVSSWTRCGLRMPSVQ